MYQKNFLRSMFIHDALTLRFSGFGKAGATKRRERATNFFARLPEVRCKRLVRHILLLTLFHLRHSTTVSTALSCTSRMHIISDMLKALIPKRSNCRTIGFIHFHPQDLKFTIIQDGFHFFCTSF